CLSGEGGDSAGALRALGKHRNTMKLLLRTICVCLLVRACVAATNDYLAVGVLLDQFIEREMRDKGIIGVAVALVDDQQIVFSRGYGVAKPDKIPGAGDEMVVTGPPMEATTAIRA